MRGQADTGSSTSDTTLMFLISGMRISWSSRKLRTETGVEYIRLKSYARMGNLREGVQMEFRPQRYRLTMVFRPILFPITMPDFFESLSKKGFEVPTQAMAPLPAGGRIYATGIVGRKKEVNIDVTAERKFIGCEGKDLSSVIEVFTEIFGMVPKDFGINLPQDLEYVEFIGNMIGSGMEKAIEQLQASLDNPLLLKINQILNAESAFFGLRIVPKSTLPRDSKWYDISIEPRVTRAESQYFVSVTFRDPEFNKVIQFAKDVPSTITKLIDVIRRDK